MTVLGFFELPDDEQPPERIWLDDEAMAAHWDRIKESREAGSRGVDLVPSAPMEQNELTAGFKR